MKTRYCISIVPSTSGMRQIYGANQGHRFHDEPGAAQSCLKAVRECSGNRETLDGIYGPGAFDSLAVSPIECYDNGDAVGIFPSETIETDNREHSENACHRADRAYKIRELNLK